jgi:hypothetical protein
MVEEAKVAVCFQTHAQSQNRGLWAKFEHFEVKQ